jgi:hypothetical protein
MKNVLLWGWSFPDVRAAAQMLVQQGTAKVVEWTADAPDVPKPFTQFLYKQPDFGSFRLGARDIYLSEAEIVEFLQRYSREKRSMGLDFHEQVNIAKNYFRYFLHLLTEKQIQHVFFEIIPITGLDYICYLAAHRLGITTTSCLNSNFPGRFFYCHRIEDFGLFEDVPSDPNAAAPEIEWGHKKDLFYMKDLVLESQYGSPGKRLLHELWRNAFRESSKPVRLSGVIQNYIAGRDFQNLYHKHAKIASPADLEGDFVYFPFHLQPEVTTSGLGGRYCDQLDAVERLSELIPQQWNILVKENPIQGCEQRGREFFHRLSSIKKVKYLRREVSTYDVMKKCRFVATVTGTAGWEAITGGKPCLIFGLAWYRKMPGVTRYSEKCSLEEILSFRFNREEVVRSFAAIYSKTRPGVIEACFASIDPDYESPRNIQHLARFMEEAIGYNRADLTQA